MKRSSLFKSNLTRLTLGGIALLACAASSSAAVTWKDIQFGGFASQGYITNTGDNDYLGDSSDGTFDFREYAANASWSKGKFRIGAQAFGQKLGEYGDDKIKLDWATIDYQPAQWLGLRVGRVKMPRGLYNEALDLDSIRPFVLLPQGVYDARLRDFNAAFNGGLLFGNVGLRKLGSLDYRAFYGDIPMSIDSGASDYLNTGFAAENLSIGMDHTLGGTIFWNTPISGLRAGYSYSEFNNLTAARRLRIGQTFLSWTRTAKVYERHLVSVEYTQGDWLFSAEAGREEAEFIIVGFGPTNLSRPAKIEYAYFAASRRLNDRLELGTYFSYSQDRQSTNPLLRQADYALSAKFDIAERLIFKLEVHHMSGAGKLFDTASKPQPLATRDDSWNLLAAKLTFSF